MRQSPCGKSRARAVLAKQNDTPAAFAPDAPSPGALASSDDPLARQAARFRDLLEGTRRIQAAGSVEETLAHTRENVSRSPGVTSLASFLGEPDVTWIEAPLLGDGERDGAGDRAPLGSLRAGVRKGTSFFSTDELIVTALAEAASLSLRQAREREALQDAVGAREDVLAMVSHDLKNPLNIIAMTLALLRQDAVPRDIPQLDRIGRAANRMNRLIGDLLDASSLEQGRLKVILRRERADEIAREAADAATAAARTRGCRVECHVTEDEAFVLADRERMLQLLSILLGNAVKFSPELGVVALTVSVSGRDVAFLVTDQGPGMDEARVRRVFERYYKTSPPSRDGVGLGLFIARGIVEGHQGTLRIDSERGRGTAVSVSIPLAP
jgi:signal transduction histidine kinase